MAEIEIKAGSSLIGFTNASHRFTVPEGLTPEDVAGIHWDFNIRFLLEQERISGLEVSEPIEKILARVAKETLTAKLPATPVAEEETERKLSAPDTLIAALGEMVEKGRVSEDALDAMLDNPPPAEKKVWETKPSFNNDLFA